MEVLKTKSYWKRTFVYFSIILIVLNVYSFLKIAYAAWLLYKSQTQELFVNGTLLDVGDYIDALKRQASNGFFYIMLACGLAIEPLPVFKK